MTDEKRSAWLQKLDENCPYQVVLPRRQLMDDSAIMDFLLSYVASQPPQGNGRPSHLERRLCSRPR